MTNNHTDDWALAVETHINNLNLNTHKGGNTMSVTFAPTDEEQRQQQQLQQQQQQQQQAPGQSLGNNNSNNGHINGTEVPESRDDVPNRAENSLMNKLLNDKLKFLNQSVSLQVQQKDPNSPLFAAKSFEELNLTENLKRALRDMQYEHPSRIQETALPLLLKEPYDNMIAQSQSGTGKTAAFVLTVLSRIDFTQNYPQALILSPTYELAWQIGLTVQNMGKYMMGEGESLIAYATKGNDPEKGMQIVQPIIIGTPGTVLKWIKRCKAFDAKKIKVVVFDEADVMIGDAGHKQETIQIKRFLSQDKSLQSLLFSATYEESVLKFAKSIIKEPNIITLRRDEESLENIKQYFVQTHTDSEKLTALQNIYGIIGAGQAMVFCKKRDTAQFVANTLHNAGHSCGVLSGKLDTMERADVIRKFRQGQIKVLVSTNVTARGIDVEQVTFVVNYDLPDKMNEDNINNKFLEADCETYLHRIGRTGRFGKTGIAVNFIVGERDRKMLKDIEHHFNKKIGSLDVTDIEEMEEKLN